jgi:hypothetical protein
MPDRPGRVPILILVALLALPAAAEEPPGASEAPPDLDARVNEAIDRGVAWLREAQQKDGSWGPCQSGGSYDGTQPPQPCYFIGPTAFSLFTLAKCGVSRRDKGVRRGLRWLREEARRPSDYRYSSYESSAVILMLTALYDEGEDLETSRSRTRPPRGSAFKNDDWEWMHERILHLVGDAGTEKGCQTRAGGWTYWPGEQRTDVSATQFALLALREASRAGYPFEEVNAGVWTHALDYLKSMEIDGGGFPYERKEEGWTAGMTAAALSSLLILEEQLGALGREPPEALEGLVERAFARLGKIYRPIANAAPPGSQHAIYHYCHLYAVERVGSLSRRQLLGGKPWYPPGAEYLINMQKEDGSWFDATCMAPQDVLGTCFALLFLKRATVPMAVVTPADR